MTHLYAILIVLYVIKYSFGLCMLLAMPKEEYAFYFAVNIQTCALNRTSKFKFSWIVQRRILTVNDPDLIKLHTHRAT